MKNMYLNIMEKFTKLLNIMGEDYREEFDFHFCDNDDFNEGGTKLAKKIVSFKSEKPYSRNWDMYFAKYILTYLESNKCTFSDFIALDQILLLITDNYLEEYCSDNNCENIINFRKYISICGCANAFAVYRTTNYSYINRAQFAKRIANIVGTRNKWNSYVESNYLFALDELKTGDNKDFMFIYYEMIKKYCEINDKEKAYSSFQNMYKKYTNENLSDYESPEEKYFFLRLLLMICETAKKMGISSQMYEIYMQDAANIQEDIFDNIVFDKTRRSCVFKSNNNKDFEVTIKELKLYIDECINLYNGSLTV